jgi:alpha-beta hydrolase superfamily lysophospholipase
MKQLSARLVKHVLKILTYGTIGSILMLLIVFVVYLDNQPELNIWHETHLDEEFTTRSKIKTFDEYRELETRLFQQLDLEIYQKFQTNEKQAINRYHRGSLSDPQRWPTNWNRSFVLEAESPRVGILLIHGMSDSPYSLKTLGESFNKVGATVVGIRLPGHGTIPSGLVHARWQDMEAAVRLAMQYLKSRVGEQPIYIVGYSNGGALAMSYVLNTLDDSKLTKVDGVIMLSPAIGVSGIAVFAKWQARLGYLLGLDKLNWNSIIPEYDPYKYGSFAVNAGDQVYRLTLEIQSQIKQHSKDELKKIPPILAFQSVVDNTVSTPALVQGLFDLLPDNGHELVLFDINRAEAIEFLMKNNPTSEISKILKQSDNTFTISLLTNKNKLTRQLKVRQRKAGDNQIIESDTDLLWPNNIYSLSHLALPIDQSDYVYGYGENKINPGIKLGDLALRGERGVLQISAASMLRLRWNPFFPYIEKRSLQFMRLE